MAATKSYKFEFPVAKKKDVVVVGGGPGGFMAALSASRNGADTLLIERDNYLGGMITGGFVNSIHGFRHRQGFNEEVVTSNWDNPLLVNGISLEVMVRIAKKGGRLEQGHVEDPSLRELVDPEITKLVLDEMMEEAKVEVLYNTFAFNAALKDNVAKGVAIANKSGGRVVLADVVVDASGDADIAAAAGVPFEIGRKEDGRLHGGSFLMDIGGIDVHKYIEYLKNRTNKKLKEAETKKLEDETSRLLGGFGDRSFRATVTLDGQKGQVRAEVARTMPWDKLDQIIEEGKVPLRLPGIQEEWLEFVKSGRVPPWHGAAKLMYIRSPMIYNSAIVAIRHGKIRYDETRSGVFEAYFDQTNQEEITKAILWMRKMNGIYMEFLRERIPGFENAYIIQMSPMVGTRESRRIIGEYTLTERDVVEGARFPDVIAKSGRHCNVHSVTGTWEDSVQLLAEKPFDIPYRCLVPKKIENLLVAGRPISVTHVAHGATRGEPACMETGEAAGAAAALSANLGVAPRNLDIKLLQKALLDQGVLLYLADEMPGAIPAG